MFEWKGQGHGHTRNTQVDSMVDVNHLTLKGRNSGSTALHGRGWHVLFRLLSDHGIEVLVRYCDMPNSAHMIIIEDCVLDLCDMQC